MLYIDLGPPLRVCIVVSGRRSVWSVSVYANKIKFSSSFGTARQTEYSSRAGITSVAHNIFQLALSFVVLLMEELFLHFV